MIRAVVYFALVFGTGFLLGIVRVLWAEPRIGTRLAELAEAPLMLAAICLAARFVVRRFPAGRAGAYLVSGGLALLLLVVTELTVVLGLRGVGIGEYVSGRDPLAGAVYLFMLALFAVMPWLLGRRPVAGR